MTNHSLRTTTVAFLLLLSTGLFAAIETASNRLIGTAVAVNAGVSAIDNKYNYMVANNTGNPPLWQQNLFSLKSGVGRVRLGVDPNCTTFVAAGYTAKVTVNISYYSDLSLTTLQSVSTQTLVVSYDPLTTNQTYQLDDRDLFEINSTNVLTSGEKVVFVKVSISAVTDENNNPITAPANLYLEASTEVERFYNLSLTSIPSTSLLTSSVNSANELVLSWGYIAGAESYDVEWTWVNDYDVNGGALSGAALNALVFDFSHNSTRVNVRKNNFAIPLVFDQGYVAFRVRAVGYAYNSSSGNFEPIYGRWTSDNATDFTYGNFNSTGHTYRVSLTAAYRLKMNWQYNGSFAEDGKKKEVVAFYDGSLHNRQTITKTSTDKKVLVGETMYDYEGRAAITVLPSPVAGGNMPLDYQVAFNRNSSALAYTAADFDKDAGSCAVSTPAMSSSYGTARYYSSSNPEQTGAQAFLPNANGYPFAQTEYAPDNTGRVRRQGGVGNTHQLNGGHETQYYYGHPFQEELDRLFGSDVGYAKHYNKTVTLDPNGQPSVTYVDQEGRTIATGLAGDTINKPLLALREGGDGTPSYSAALVSNMVVDMLGKDADPDKDDDQDNNLLNSAGNMLEVSNQLVVAATTTYSFAYSLTGDKFSYPCLPQNVCYSCVYDLEIDIVDQCGNRPTLTQGTLPIVQTLGTLSYDCAQSVASFNNTPTPLIATLNPGVYTVYKRLKVNEATLQTYTANYLTQTNCVTSQTTMVNASLATVDTTSCHAACTDCDDYQSPCETSYRMMLSDVSPNGQYAQYRDNNGVVNTAMYPVSVMNTSNTLRLSTANWRNPVHETHPTNPNHYYEADGTTISYIALSGTSPNYFPAVDNISNVTTDASGNPRVEPHHLANVEDFTQRWRESWALSLVKYHPEYCYYEWCKGNGVVQTGSTISSDEFDRLILATNTKAAAVAAGLLDPMANADGSADQNAATDPYVRTNGLGSSQFSTMEAQMRNYSGTNSIWKMAKIMTTCGTMYNASQAQIDACTGSASGNETNYITGDAEWQNFKMLYLSLKQHYQQDKADASAMTCDGYNGCIGTNSFAPASCGMIDFSNFGNSEFFDRNPTRQPCSDVSFMYYSDKQKRFVNEDDVMGPLTGNATTDLASIQNTVYNNNTMLTGQCPLAADLQNFLSGMAASNQLKATSLNLQTVTSFGPGLYNAIVTTGYTQVNYSGSGTAATLTMAFSGTNVNCGTSPTLVFGPSSSYSWTNYNIGGGFRITSFSGLVADGSGGFGIIAYIDHDMNTATPSIPEYMTGTGGCISLTCTLPTECPPNALANDLVTLLNLVTAGGDLANTTGANLTTGGNYSTFFNGSQVNNYLNCGAGTDTYWRMNTSLSEYRVQCTNTTGTPTGSWLKLSFTPALPSGTINSFSLPVISSPGQAMTLTVTYNTTSTTTVTLTVDQMANTSKVNTLTMGSCGNPVPEQCEGVEYQRRTDLEALFNSKTGSSFTTTDNSLHYNAAFTNHLQLFGTGSYSWTPISSPSNSQWINITSGSQTCALKLSFANTPQSGNTFSNIDHFGQLVADEVNMVNGQAFNFTIVAWYSNGTSELINGTSCYAIRNCPVCVSAATSLHEKFDMVNTSSPGYTTSLTYSSACPTTSGNYTLTNMAATTCSDNTLTGGDHSNQATGKYYYGNFAKNSTHTVWSKINTVAANTPYTFTGWYMDPTSGTYTAGATATVQLLVNGTVIASANVDDTRPGEWKVLTGSWNGANTAASCTTEVKVVINTVSDWKIAFDDFSFYTPGCGPTYIPPVSPTYPYNPPCATNLINIATLNGQIQYQQYAAQVSADFAADYTKHCIGQAVETFKVTFNEMEYQYTLYYYDQGGNLSRTVPPQGVTIVNLTADDNTNGTSNGQEIKNQRQARLSNPSAAKTYYTAHRMMTTYKYNSLNQLVQQTTPDGGTTYFFYDKLGRIIASQNAKQAAQATQAWSYTIYDALGRISEVGELYTNTDLKTMSSVTLYNTLNASNYPDNWAGTASTNNRKDVTRTYYDAAQSFGVSAFFSTGAQKNLRKRVAHAAIYDTYNGTNTAYTSASHYSYDIHGNVEEVVQETAELGALDDATAGVYQRYKNIRYKYDLVSGNVNELAYQEGQADRFYYRYTYDADNRVVGAWTSRDKRHWDRDAKYFYYQHGPLSRTEVGNEKVQGADYIYTIHGWIKGVNSNGLGATNDLGNDAGTGNHKYVGTDEYGYSLSYYNGDFSTISATNAIASISGSGLDAASANLYNGNIRHMVTSVRYFTGAQLPTRAMAYKYDQLNRIRSAEQYTNYNSGTNSWNSGGSGDTEYRENYTYDHNGNIIQQYRNGQSGNTSMDNLHYYYYTTSGGTYDPATGTPSNATNKLSHVTDAVTSTYNDDVDNQSSNNYTYDQIGQLKSDAQEQIQTIDWTVYGKIRTITRTSGSTKPDLEYHYDATGQRYVKITKPRTGGNPSTQDEWTYTYYMRDASGNVLSTYERKLPKNGATYNDEMKLKEQHLYGSSRVGIRSNDLVLTTKTYNFTSYNGVYLQGTLNNTTTPALSATRMKHTMNMKAYEQSNHLGNVLVTVSDARQVLNSGSTVTGYMAIVKSAGDYSSFGAPKAGRTYTSTSYRYGFNGKENDAETSTQDYGMRIYNNRLGRFLSVDPLTNKYAYLTPYQFASNRPIDGIDLDGLEYLRSDEARVEFEYGELRVKVENCHNVTQNRIKLINENPEYWTPGEMGCNITIGKLSFFSTSAEQPDPGLANRHESPSGRPGDPNKSTLPTAPAGGNSTLAKTAIAVDAINFGLAEATKWQLRDDMDVINEQSIVAQQALADVNRALNENPPLIPPQYQNAEALTNIANVVLQGVNNTEDPEIMRIGMLIYNTYHPAPPAPEPDSEAPKVDNAQRAHSPTPAQLGDQSQQQQAAPAPAPSPVPAAIENRKVDL